MALSQEIHRRIKAKEAEITRFEDHIAELRTQIKSATAYIQGLKDILPKVAREEGPNGADESKEVEIRPGSAPDRVRALLTEKGTPLHITAILAALGREHNKANRVSLSGTLARFVRNGVIFSRPAPNTFGLLTMAKASPASKEDDELPEGFGK